MAVPRPLIRSVLLIGIVLTALVSAYAVRGEPTHRIAEMHSVAPARTLAGLWTSATVIAVVRPTGASSVHWNSADGREWKADAPGSPALIVRDDVFTITTVLKGQPGSDRITIRGVGGTINDVTMTYDGQTEWKRDAEYLVFLRRVDTPTKEGSESAWTEVEIGQSSLQRTAKSRWNNGAGLDVTLDDVARLGG